MASTARAVLIGLALVACSSGDDDVAVTTTTTSSTTTTTATTTTVAPITDAWDRVPSPDTSCFVVADESGDLVIDHNADVPVVPASVIKLLPASLAPTDSRVVPMLRDSDSDNDAARSLVDELGGVGAVRDALVAASRPMAGVVVADATGHDRANRVTCRLLVSILSSTPLADSLAAAGESGTLAGRYVQHAGRLRAKTGSIRGVSLLAGYVMPSGHPGPGGMAFAAVLNADTDPTPALDSLVEGLLP